MDVNLGPLAATMASVTWAIGVIAYSKLSHHYPAYIINFHRILLGLPAFLLVLFFQGNLGELFVAFTGPHLSWTLFAVLCSYAFGDVLFLLGTKKLGAPSALAIASTYPLWSALADLMIRDITPTVFRTIGMFLVVVGTVIVILSTKKSEELVAPVPRLPLGSNEKKSIKKLLAGINVSGVLVALSCSLCWAGNAFAIAKTGEEMGAVMLNAFRFSLALILCPLVGVLIYGRKTFTLVPKKVFLPFLPIFLVESIGGPFFYVYGLSNSPLAIGAPLTALAPVISVPFAILWGKEKFSFPKTVGIVLVVAGVWILL